MSSHHPAAAVYPIVQTSSLERAYGALYREAQKASPRARTGVRSVDAMLGVSNLVVWFYAMFHGFSGF
jgi:hypothetical protein